MTEPGYIAPHPPGWWVRTKRVGTNATYYNLSIKAKSSNVATGISSGSYGWIGAATGNSIHVSVAGVDSSATNTVNIPAHSVGQMILLWAYRKNSNTTPTKPSASGTVPAYVDVLNNTGTNTNSARTAYFVATATNHTSGTWTNATGMIAVVIDGQAVSPIGGKAEAGGSHALQSVAPSITLTSSTGSSLVLHFFGSAGNTVGWSAAPAGYVHLVNSGSWCMNSKTLTTSDGACTQPHGNTPFAPSYSGTTVEILD